MLISHHVNHDLIKSCKLVFAAVIMPTNHSPMTETMKITNPTAKSFFRIMDHNTIFFLIAGTYTPITISILRGAIGWVLFGVVWGAAVIGIVLNSIDLERFRKPSVVCYIAMGWVIIFAIHPLLKVMNAWSLWLLVGGGVFYTVGVIFYAIKKVRYFHSVWHIFTVAGSVCHYFSVLFAVINR